MENDLIQRAQQDDQQAFQQLVELYGQLVWRTAYALLADRSQVEDAVQEAWLDVWRGLKNYQHTRPFRPWLLTTVANRCRKVMRKHVVPQLPLENGAMLADAYDAEAHVLRQEADVELLTALAILSPEQRRILELHFFAGLVLSEIALVTDTLLGTVKSRLQRALDALRMHLRQTAFAEETL